MPASPESHPPRRLFGLDAFRAIAIVLVVLNHGKFMLHDTVLEGFPFFQTIDGVDLFFVLSGFLIGRILLEVMGADAPPGHRDLWRFWIRRWFRTLPAYYLVLGLNVLVVGTGIISEDFSQFSYRFFLFLQNFSTPFYGFFWESWSLSIEEWFYLLTPIFMVGLRRFMPIKPAFLIATLAMIALPVGYRFLITNPTIDAFGWDVTFRKVVLCRLDSIGYGLLAAWAARYLPVQWNNLRWPAFAGGLLLIAALMNVEAPVGSVYKQVWYFSLTPFAAMLLLPLAASVPAVSGAFARSVVHISKISYAMYLINLALVAEVIRDNFPPTGGWEGILKYVCYWAVVLVASTLLYRYFEKPIMDLRDRVS